MAETNFQQLVRVLVTPFQDVEDLLRELLADDINTAVGAQLADFGRLVGLPPSGLSDDIYRRRIRAKISTNRSSGRRSQLLSIAHLVVFSDTATFVIEPQYPAAYTMFIEDSAVGGVSFEVGRVVAELLRDATSAGVRSFAQVSATSSATTFGFEDSDGLGFGSLVEIDLDPLTANVDTVVRARDNGLPWALEIALDGAGAGSITVVDEVVTFHAQSGVTTVANFESAINASANLLVKTAGTGANVFAAGDALEPTTLTEIAGIDGGGLASIME